MRFSMKYKGGSIALAFCVYQSPMPCSARVVSFHAKVYYKTLQAPSSPARSRYAFSSSTAFTVPSMQLYQKYPS